MLKTNWNELRQAVKRSKRRQAYYEIFVYAKGNKENKENNAMTLGNAHVSEHTTAR